MSLEILKNDIAQCDFKRLYYVHGNEFYLKQFYMEQIKKSMFKDDDDFTDLVELSGNSLSENDLLQAVDSFPVSSKKKLVIVKDIPFNSDCIRYITDHEEILNDDTVLVFYDMSERIKQDGTPVAQTELSKKFIAFVKKYGVDVKIDKLDNTILLSWIAKQVRIRSCHIYAKEAQYLIDCVGNDMFKLLGEISKLCSYSEGEITINDIDTMCIKTPDAKMYELTDSIFKKNSGMAFHVLNELLQNKTDPVRISAAIVNYIANLYRLKLMDSSGCNLKDMCSDTGMRDFVIKKILPRLRSITEDAVGEMVEKCTKCDLALKSTSSDTEAILTRLVTELISLC